jgi:hypothetical protein
VRSEYKCHLAHFNPSEQGVWTVTLEGPPLLYLDALLFTRPPMSRMLESSSRWSRGPERGLLPT